MRNEFGKILLRRGVNGLPPPPLKPPLSNLALCTVPCKISIKYVPVGGVDDVARNFEIYLPIL